MIRHTKSRPGLKDDRRAVTAVEYCLIAAFIALVIVASVATLGPTVNVPFVTMNGALAK